ncbi:glycine cleavage system aminomethyltransferase GcvT [soil metagenome]
MGAEVTITESARPGRGARVAVMSEVETKLSPLHEAHLELGAKMADFGGWSMPIEYAGGGVVAEHTAVRDAVGLFDVSHLGKAIVSGPGAADFVNTALTNDLDRITAGQAQYTMCCGPGGGVIDDLIAYRVGDDEVFLIPNAANTSGVVAQLREAAPDGITVQGAHDEFAVLAVQGPRSDEVLRALGLPTEHDFMSFVDATFAPAQGPQMEVRVCRTGYTGERGFELVVGTADAVTVWSAVLGAAVDAGGRVCGLGARDTLRTEMGYALHGHELSAEISPVMARTGWAVGWDKPQFWGRAALLEQREKKSGRLSRGLLATGRGVPRAGCGVVTADGQAVGEVTSGTFSPTLKQGIALALLDRSVAVGDEVSIDVRGRLVPAVVTKPPFVEVHTR